MRASLKQPAEGASTRVEVVLRTSRSLADFKRDDIDLAIRFAPGPSRGLHGELLCGEELCTTSTHTPSNRG